MNLLMYATHVLCTYVWYHLCRLRRKRKVVKNPNDGYEAIIKNAISTCLHKTCSL